MATAYVEGRARSFRTSANVSASENSISTVMALQKRYAINRTKNTSRRRRAVPLSKNWPHVSRTVHTIRSRPKSSGLSPIGSRGSASGREDAYTALPTVGSTWAGTCISGTTCPHVPEPSGTSQYKHRKTTSDVSSR